MIRPYCGSKARAILEEIQALPPAEQGEICHFILEHLAALPPLSRRRKISDIAGKYRADPDLEAKDHDCGFATAAAVQVSCKFASVLTLKRGRRHVGRFSLFD